jgi:hypothetical protein
MPLPRLAWAMRQLGRGFGPGARERMGHQADDRGRALRSREGCRGAFLDTHSFQARPFYEELGYKEFGVLEDHPPGHTHYWLTKKLVAKP